MISMTSDETVSPNTLYIFDGMNRKVKNSRTINSTISNVEYVDEGIMFCGFDEVYICDISSLKSKLVVKTSANVGQCISLVFNQAKCLLAHRHNRPNVVNVVNVRNDMSATQFQPFDEELPVSFIKISHDVPEAHQGKLIAVADGNGCLIVTFHMSGFARLQKFFRGYQSNVIKDICFSPNYHFLSAMSMTGTLHVFKIDTAADGKSNLLSNMILTVNKFTDSVSDFAKCSTRYMQKNEVNPSI